MDMQSAKTNTYNMERMGNFYEAFAAGDLDKVLSFLAPSVVIHETESLPYGGDYAGHEGFLDLMGHFNRNWENMRPVEIKMTAADNMVIANLLLLATHRQTGRELAMPLCEVWKLKDGDVVEGHIFYEDTHKVRQICGME